MKIIINGNDETIEKAKINISELLILFKVKMPDMVSVQHNGEFAKRENFEKTFLKEGDVIDFLYFMGGGI
jgi:sulfur carrier protein